MKAALMRACTARGTLRVTGPDRITWLNGLLTCDISQVVPGRAAWGLLLNRVGKIQSELWVLAAGDSLLLSVSPGTLAAVVAELDQRLVMEDAELTDVSESYRWYFLEGADALSSAAACAGGVSAALDLFRSGTGAVLAVPSGVQEPDVESLDDTAFALLGIRSGTGVFGTDYSAEDRPHEAALERRAIAWNKGCYLGQEVVCMQDMRGKVKHSLRTLSAAAPADSLLVGASVVTEAQKVVGDVRSAAYDVAASHWWLLAHIELQALADPLQVKVGSGTYPVQPPSNS
jgi:tRNA-modifying protein YgfZ